jgi:hypothetical protein
MGRRFFYCLGFSPRFSGINLWGFLEVAFYPRSVVDLHLAEDCSTYVAILAERRKRARNEAAVLSASFSCC